jgi:pimeloyl-ACP methyl ester carboxylesterase
MSAPSVYDRMCWPEAQLEHALASGEYRLELSAYLGKHEYATLSALARAAASARARPEAPTLYLLPGILGSQLISPRAPGEPPDLLWLDPDDIVDGRLTELHPQHPRALQTFGPVVHSYLALKLRLVAAGYRVVFHDYDWRDDVLASGRALAARLEADPAKQLVLVGHSMGGLLARAALRHCDREFAAARITRVIGLGAPHGGSMAAVQALRATYPVVCRLAAIDQHHDARALTSTVFRYFMSLYQMLPAESASLNLYDPANWPSEGVTPDPERLQRARDFSGQLAVADERFVSIVGTSQRTVTGIERRGQEFLYEVSSAGDGTVAVARATLPGSQVYSVRCEHSELPRSPTVAEALIDLIRSGHTRRLGSGVVERPGRKVYLTDARIGQEFARKQDWHRFSISQRRRYLDRISAAPVAYRSRAHRSSASDSMQKL